MITPGGPSATASMTRSASEFLRSLDPGQRRTAAMPPDDPDRHRWTYLPGSRAGLCLTELSGEQRGLLEELVRAWDGVDGAATGAIRLERARRTLVLGDEPDGDNYWVRFAGDPGEGRWSWRINGHHLAVHVEVGLDGYTITPHFVGAEPALLPADAAGLPAGHRLAGPEEDLARELVAALDPDRRAVACPTDVAPNDILTRFDPVADPAVLPPGLTRAQMDAPQQQQLDALVSRYLRRAPADYAAKCWAEARTSGLDDIEFAWLGPAERGHGHYYCVRAPMFLIEYDNTQDDANHVHSVWRHLRDDWGGDLLRAHYEESHR